MNISLYFSLGASLLFWANPSEGASGRLGHQAKTKVSSTVAKGGTVQDHIVSCQNNPDPIVFTVKLQFDDGDWFEAMCARSYNRCPFDDGSCLGGDDDWTAESGKSFDYLETRVSLSDLCLYMRIF